MAQILNNFACGLVPSFISMCIDERGMGDISFYMLTICITAMKQAHEARAAEGPVCDARGPHPC